MKGGHNDRKKVDIMNETMKATFKGIIKGFGFDDFIAKVYDLDTNRTYDFIVNTDDLFNYVVDSFIATEYEEITDFFYMVSHDRIDEDILYNTINDFIDDMVFSSGNNIEQFDIDCGFDLYSKVFYSFDDMFLDFRNFMIRNCDR